MDIYDKQSQQYPEHLRLLRARKQLDELQKFLSFLYCHTQSYTIARIERDDSGYDNCVEVNRDHDITQLLHEYVGVDVRKLETEKEVMYAEALVQWERKNE